jgi:predicted nucleic acid-binding Zn ribbon protein
LNTQSNVKSPEEIAQEKQNEINEAKRKRRRNIIIGVVVVGLVVTAIVGYKKGWFKKG